MKTLPLCLVALGLPAAALLAQERHLLHYDFNQELEDGRVVNLASGNDTYDRSGALIAPGRVEGGVFDSVQSSMGERGGAVHTDNGGFGNVSSFTISLWYKTDNPDGLSRNARLFDTALGGRIFALADPGSDPGSLQVYSGVDGAENGGALIQAPHPIYSRTQRSGNGLYKMESGGISGKWIFVAVTYDGSVNGKGVFSLYAGSETEPVTLVETFESTAMPEQTRMRDIAFGGTTSGSRSFQGRLDDIRVTTAYERSPQGALPPEQIEEIRQQGARQLPTGKNN